MGLPTPEKVLGTRKAEAVFLALACAAALLYRGWDTLGTLVRGVPEISHISYDGVYYAQIAKNFLSGAGPGWEAMIFPVLQPVFVAAISWLTGTANLAFLAVCVNEVAGALLLVPVYYLAREYFGKTVAAATVVMLIPYPHLVAIAGGDTTESLYSFLVFLSLFLCYRAIDSKKGPALFIAGAALGATYLARPEGLILFAAFVLIAFTVLMRALGPYTAFRKAGLALAGFTLLALPYAVFLHGSYGRLVLSPKLPYESVVMKAKVLGLPLNMSEVDGLTPSGMLAWQENGGAGLIAGYFRNDPGKLIGVYADNLVSELPWNVRNSSHLEGYPIVYPLYFWLPAILAFGALAYRPESRWKAALLWAPFINLFVYPVFTNGFWIYHVPYVPALVMLAAAGYTRISDMAAKRVGFAVPVLLAVTVAWTGYSVYVNAASSPEYVEVIAYKKYVSDESMNAGRDVRNKFGSGAVYMMRWSRLVYYLGGRWTQLPVSSNERIIEYGRANGAGYIVEELVGDETVEGPRFLGTPGLELKYMYQSSGTPYVVMVWKIEDTTGLASGM